MHQDLFVLVFNCKIKPITITHNYIKCSKCSIDNRGLWKIVVYSNSSTALQ
jgi:hypothetical protein